MNYLEKLSKLIKTFPELVHIINSKANYYFNISGVPHCVYAHPTADTPISYIEMDCDMTQNVIVPREWLESVNEIDKLHHIAKIVLNSKYVYDTWREELPLHTIVCELIKDKLFRELPDDYDLAFVKNTDWTTKDESVIKDILE